MRKPHTLRPTSGDDRPTRVIFLDTETNQRPAQGKAINFDLRLGYAKLCRTRRSKVLAKQSDHVIRNIDEFWDWVDSKTHAKTLTYMVAHNLNFDLPVLHTFRQLPERGWILKGFYTSGHVNIFRWRKDDRKLYMLDNANFFSGALASWGDMIGLPKLGVDFDDVSDADLLTYCKRDVEIMVQLWRLWVDFLDKHDCGSFRMTVSSTAFNTFRHSYMKHRIYIHDDQTALDLARAAYKGGRTECFFKGRVHSSQYYYVDVNSMYAHVMREQLFPARLYGSKKNPSRHMLKRKTARLCVIAEVDLETTQPWYPLILDGYTTYPIGRFTTTLTTPELQLAIDNNWIRNVRAMAWYAAEPLFADYVDYFYNIRLAYKERGMHGFGTIAKLLINTLYGKFGQQGIHIDDAGECDVNHVEKRPLYDGVKKKYGEEWFFGGKIYHVWSEGESYNSLPEIAAHVTAYARMHIYALAREVPDGHYYYTDTDSLIVDQVGLDALSSHLSDTQLGKLKIEVQSPWLEVNAPKDYALEGHVRTKGVSPHATQLSKNVYRQLQWRRISGMIRAGNLDGYQASYVEKHLQRVIRSGLVLPSGRIEPFQVAVGWAAPDAPPDQHP